MRLFGSPRGHSTSAAVPATCLVYAVGDIHGRADLLVRMHRLIQAHGTTYPDERKVVVYLGDYVDRGLESRQVIDLLLDEPLSGFESVYLKGNHEDFMLRFLSDSSVGVSWLFNGGNATLFSYGVAMPDVPDPEARMALVQTDLKQRLPERHLDFLRRLRASHVEGDYLFVHAGIRPGIPLKQQSGHDLMWIREDFLKSGRDHGKIVVHGHSITWEPDVRENRIGIDTGAFASGVLTCLALHGTAKEFLHTE